VKITEEELIGYLQRKLGSSFWALETDVNRTKPDEPFLEHYRDAINDALIAYSRWKPARLKRAYTGREGIFRLDKNSNPALPEDVTGMVDWRHTTNIAMANPNIEAQMLSSSFAYYGVRDPMYDITFLHYQRMWIELAGRELSSKPDVEFRLNEAEGHPEMWFYSPGFATNFEVWYSKQHNLRSIPDYDELIFKDLAVSRVKVVLGEIRSKYDRVPMANISGGVSLNGAALKTEGAAEWEAANEKLARSEAALAVEWL
jgi:hypothetical protein